MGVVNVHKRDRRSYVIKLLSEQPSVTVAELRDAFDISEVSVRKLLDAMEKEGTIRRTWGGAVSALGSMGESSYEEKVARDLSEKQAIAALAYDCILDGEAVYLDSGTTTLQLARLLAKGDKRKTLVCTNALNVALEFRAAEDMEVIVIGGKFQAGLLSCGGGFSMSMLQTLFFDKAFLSGSHFSLERGLTTPNMQEAEIKRAVLSAAQERYVLADYSKYGKDSLALIAPAGEMGTLITDWRAPDDVLTRFEKENVRVLRAESKQSEIA